MDTVGRMIRDFRDGETIQGKFAVRTKESPRDYRSKPGRYFFLGIGDRTGTIQLKFWGGGDAVRVMDIYNAISIGDVVEVTGDVEVDRFDSTLILSLNEDVHEIRVCSDEEVTLEDFIPRSERNLDEMLQQIREHAQGVKDPHLNTLLENFLSDADFATRLKNAPATILHHHNYIGGLMEHILGVLDLLEALCNQHPKLDRDLLVSAAILHDAGKVSSYDLSSAIEMTDESKFLGHLLLSDRMLRKKLSAQPDFPDLLRWKLAHLILSHHGNTEGGAPKRLRLPEAAALYWANELDSNVTNFLQQLESQEDNEDDWTYIRSLGGEVYLRRSSEAR